MKHNSINFSENRDRKDMRKTILQVLIHVVAWMMFLSLPAFFKPPRPGEPELDIIGDILYTPRLQNSILLIIVFYFNYYVAIPLLYFRKRYWWFALSIVVALGGLLLIGEIMMPEDIRRHRSFFTILGPSHKLFMFINVYVLSFALRLYTQWRKVREEQLNTEVSFLKAQINPHFLFNTLNSIYSLAITKSDKAPDAVVQLSSLMRYSVTDAEKEYVPLSKEVSYIKDYISLQKLRLTGRVDLSVDIGGDFIGKEITPFILTPFIENAFKYGVNTEENSIINIIINFSGSRLKMEVMNSKVYVLKDEYSVSGLGIKNSQKRLRHYYPKSHELVIEDEDDYFKVTLTIEL